MSGQRWYSTDLPAHYVIEMPALSPTMEIGTLVSWSVEVGDEVEAGDQLGEIETDKATMAFDSPEDGFIGKLLVEEGDADIPLGMPLIVIAEEADDVAAFESYVAAAAPAAAASAAAAPTPATPAAAAAPPAAAPAAAPAATPVVLNGEMSQLDAQLLARAEAAIAAKYPGGIPA